MTFSLVLIYILYISEPTSGLLAAWVDELNSGVLEAEI